MERQLNMLNAAGERRRALSGSDLAMQNAQPVPGHLVKARHRGLLSSLASFMASRNAPLPPELTGVPYPDGYDPSDSPWKSLVPTSEPGCVRLADGVDLDIIALFTFVQQLGGSTSVNRTNGWPTVVNHCQLPQDYRSRTGSTTSTAYTLAQLYNALLAPFEEAYRQSLARTRAQQMMGDHAPLSSLPGGGGPSFANNVSQTHPMSPTLSSTNHTGFAGSPPAASLSGMAVGDLAGSFSAAMHTSPELTSGGKRPREGDGDEMQRMIRQRTGTEAMDHRSSSMNGLPSLGRKLPGRRKIEYVPLTREMLTHGGRDLQLLEQELAKAPQRRVKRHTEEWGTVDVEALTMSLRSRIPTELAYALTAFAFMTLMQSSAPGSGFPLHSSVDFFEEILDLLEEAAFDGGETPDLDPSDMIAHSELVQAALDDGMELFARPEIQTKDGMAPLGIKQRPGDIVLTIINILRNLSNYSDNHGFLAQHPSFLRLLLRLCDLESAGHEHPRPAAPGIRLSDLVVVRKDVLCILCNIAGVVRLAHPEVTPQTLRTSTRIFALMASFLLDTTEFYPPVEWIIRTGGPLNTTVHPPLDSDMALEVFSKLSHPDVNRQIIATSTPTEWLWRVLEALVYRLPAVERDFTLGLQSEPWMSYMEKTFLSIYSIVFLASPELKRRMKLDWTLCLPKVLFRLANKFMVHQNAEHRSQYAVCGRRVVETLKLIDEGVDSFDMTQSSTAVLAFGMGHGEGTDTHTETGVGLLAGHREEMVWGLMLQRDVDALIFAELESLARVTLS